jgi:hypothetical protein
MQNQSDNRKPGENTVEKSMKRIVANRTAQQKKIAITKLVGVLGPDHLKRYQVRKHIKFVDLIMMLDADDLKVFGDTAHSLREKLKGHRMLKTATVGDVFSEADVVAEIRERRSIQLPDGSSPAIGARR